MIVPLNDLFVVFALEYHNLLRVFPVSLDFESLDLEKPKSFDPITVQYSSQGKYYFCSCAVKVTKTDVELIFDNDFELKLNLPLLEYETDNLIEPYIDNITTDMFDKYDLLFTLSIDRIIAKLKELYLK